MALGSLGRYIIGEQAAVTDFAYIGLVGSQRWAKSVFECGDSRELSKQTLAWVQAPEVLALEKCRTASLRCGVLAELVMLGAVGDLVTGVPPQRPEVGEVLDPVCDMSARRSSQGISEIPEGLYCLSFWDVPEHRKIPLYSSGRGRSRESDVRIPRAEGE